MTDLTQRMLRRQKLLDSMDLLYQEMSYYRDHKERPSTPLITVWHYDNDDGASDPIE